MNISFHYFTVKTLCHFADLPEARAQDIAFYSQFIDDFNLTQLDIDNGFYVSQKPPDFFINNNLARETIFKTWFFYPVTTGISLAQSMVSVLNEKHQLFTIIPFHFIPPAKIDISKVYNDDYAKECLICKQAEANDGSFISEALNEVVIRGKAQDMKLGMLLHTYADTFSHQHFSGRQGDENSVKMKKIINTNTDKTVEFNSTFYSLSPNIGHGKAGHVPDAFALKYEMLFEKQSTVGVYTRDNMEAFLECAKRIWSMLRTYNGQPPQDEKWFDNEIAPGIRKAGYACINGAEEISSVKNLVKIWKESFPDIKYLYHYSNRWERGLSSWQPPELSSKDNVDGIYDWLVHYKPSPTFYAFNQLAYEHIFKLEGKYRLEDLLYV